MWPYDGLGLHSFALPTFANSRGGTSSCGRAGQEHHKAEHVPNKSLLLSAHNLLNNIYLMACCATQGVGLLGGTQKHGHNYNLK